MDDTVVTIENLGKQYRIGQVQESYQTLGGTLVGALASPWHRIRSVLRGQPIMSTPSDTIWALRNVSLKISRGEVVGFVGSNGAGKTTLLRILSQITEPTEGFAEIRGRVGSLLEVGTGFHEELSGRENIFLNGAILGMGRSEMRRKFDEIVDFAEVEKFIDTPIKRYSTGMKVRLAFSVAAHLDPEILIVDEVLSVGDASFQQKCLGHLESTGDSGKTVLFVSHNMGAVRSLCTRCIWLDGGRIVQDGSPAEVIQSYLDNTVAHADEGTVSLDERTDRTGDGRVRFTSFVARLAGGTDYDLPRTGQDMELVVGYRSGNKGRVPYLRVGVDVKNTEGQPVIYLGNRYEGTPLSNLPPEGKLICRIPSLPMQPGRYYARLICDTGGRVADKIPDAVMFEVLEGDYFGTGALPPKKFGDMLIRHRWICQPSTDGVQLSQSERN